MANFKDIMAMCLTGASYAAISAALEEGVRKFVCEALIQKEFHR
ncbi:hypothetical protein [Corynebacterium coyleae]|nr:hypothetical protein [Corynebacterium coyleae]